MKDVVKFRWEGSVEDESGLAIYETGLSTYSLRLPNLRTARLIHMAMSNVYREGYEDGIHKVKSTVRSALSGESNA